MKRKKIIEYIKETLWFLLALVYMAISVIGPYIIGFGIIWGIYSFFDSEFFDLNENKYKKIDFSSLTNSQYNNIPYHNAENSSIPPFAEFSEEEKEYLHNSLETGATPYKDIYGANYVCHRSQCSGIKVTAPRESDIVVIIKKGNSAGKVVQHGYIKAGDTYQFDVPDGTYQTFFYYGKGWYPNKPMKDGVKGGFLTDELFSKDDKPQKVYSAVLSYVLQLQKSGNFQTKSSNKGEVF